MWLTEPPLKLNRSLSDTDRQHAGKHQHRARNLQYGNGFPQYGVGHEYRRHRPDRTNNAACPEPIRRILAARKKPGRIVEKIAMATPSS